AKEYFTGQFLLALEESMEHMLWLGENVTTLNRIYTQKEILEALNKTKIEDVQRIANEIFRNDRFNLAIIGPLSDRDKKEIESNLTI
ncbi:MAG: hypothetical protein N2Z79_01355, partial [Candidatus Omnitrophica bacterium]|nr:hypothetical protein [Candidatus Omnitrophota bacterium]